MVAGVEMISEWEDAPHQWVVKTVYRYQLAIEYVQKNGASCDTYVHGNVI